jgi:hypothetical protein
MQPGEILSSHRYFMTHEYSGDGSVREMPPPPWRKGIHAEMRYPYDVLELVLPQLPARGLHFFFTKNAYQLPEYGPHVVSILLQEERCKVPVYGRYIRATIRNLMSRPFLGYVPHRRMGRAEAVLTFEFLRDTYTSVRSRLARQFATSAFGTPIRKEPLTLRLPLGYHSQEEVPYIPIADRTLDMFFAGEVRHPVPKNDYRYYLSTSKFEVRGQLFRELDKLQQEEPEWRIDRGAIASTDSKRNEQAFNTYSEKMMNSRICLAPRGTLPDTFRHFEGMRAGAMVISNPVPREEFLFGAPMLMLNHWAELRGLLHRYGHNNDFIQELGDRGRAWYHDKVRPEVVAELTAKKLLADPEFGGK